MINIITNKAHRNLIISSIRHDVMLGRRDGIIDDYHVTPGELIRLVRNQRTGLCYGFSGTYYNMHFGIVDYSDRWNEEPKPVCRECWRGRKIYRKLQKRVSVKVI